MSSSNHPSADPAMKRQAQITLRKPEEGHPPGPRYGKEEHVSVSNLRINLDDLLRARTVESERIEFKATWDSKVTGHQVLKTICAFANDLRRHGSGYVVLGVAEKDGRAELPPRGLTSRTDGRGRSMDHGKVPYDRARATSPASPGRRTTAGRFWLSGCPPARTRRTGLPTANGGPGSTGFGWTTRQWTPTPPSLLTQLHEQSAVVPWDSRTATDATVDDISETKVREHLRDCGSALSDEPDARHIYRKMDLVRRVNDHEPPLNVALLFFSRDPSRWFSGAVIETSILQSGAAGDTFRDKTFKGGLAEQVRGCLDYLRREVIGSRIDKVPDQVSALNRSSYPEDALREVLVNAVFHRGYGDDTHRTRPWFASCRIASTSEALQDPSPESASTSFSVEPHLGSYLPATRGLVSCSRRPDWPRSV